MDFAAIYHFLFEQYAGIGVLVAAGLIISIVAAMIMEVKTRKTFVDRGEEPENAWEANSDANDANGASSSTSSGTSSSDEGAK
jgi:hypothetical protein